ncbi:hypothetical protein D3C80_1290640 [compost metagenome]
MPLWIPSREDIALIKHYASEETGLAAGRLILEPGAKFNIDDDDVITNINIALVTKCTDDSWEDTDLFSCYELTEFKKGVELTADGKAIIDFYVSNKDGLHGNVAVYYSAGRIDKIIGFRVDGQVLYTAR